VRIFRLGKKDDGSLGNVTSSLENDFKNASPEGKADMGVRRGVAKGVGDGHRLPALWVARGVWKGMAGPSETLRSPYGHPLAYAYVKRVGAVFHGVSRGSSEISPGSAIYYHSTNLVFGPPLDTT
jgi:hypothetical protein